jgi:hypothetical protein
MPEKNDTPIDHEETAAREKLFCEQAVSWEDYALHFRKLINHFFDIPEMEEWDYKVPETASTELKAIERYINAIGALFDDLDLHNMRADVAEHVEWYLRSKFNYSKCDGNLKLKKDTPFHKLCGVIGLSREETKSLQFLINEWPQESEEIPEKELAAEISRVRKMFRGVLEGKIDGYQAVLDEMQTDLTGTENIYDKQKILKEMASRILVLACRSLHNATALVNNYLKEWLKSFGDELEGYGNYGLVIEQDKRGFYGEYRNYPFGSFPGFYNTFHFLRRAVLALHGEGHTEHLHRIDEKIAEIDEILKNRADIILEKTEELRGNPKCQDFLKHLAFSVLFDLMHAKGIEKDRIETIRNQFKERTE